MKSISKSHQVIELDNFSYNFNNNNNNFVTSGDSVQLLSFTDEEEADIILHEHNLANVLDAIPEDMPVSIVSIIGAFRTGKSFILNVLLKFFESNAHRHHFGINADRIFENNDIIPGNRNSFNNGFVWCNGIESQTMGIWIWNKPIIYNHPINGSRAIILLDTQGLFDLNTNQKKTITLFGMSALMSSHVIYNVDKRIQEDNLQHLALFSAYGQLINKDMHKGKCLQTLQFLVRDWQNFEEMESNLELGEYRLFSDRYLDTVFGNRNSQDLNNTRNQIKNCFNKITCSFLPHPGLKATSNGFTGNIKDLNESFVKHVKKYINETFITNELEIKKLGDVELKANQIFSLVENYLNIFKNEKGFPRAITILESTIMIQHNIAVEKSLEDFKYSMNKFFNEKNYYLFPPSFNSLLQKSKKNSFDTFRKYCTLGDFNVINNSKTLLQKKIEKETKIYIKLNEERRPLKILGPYLIPLLGFVISIIMSKVFYTCSSTLAICHEFYFLFSIIYYLSITSMIIFLLLDLIFL